jgi:protein gp37
MSLNSHIEWTDATWNPVRGCTKVSPGCAHCYAETFAERFRGVPGHPYEQGFDLRLVPGKLADPLRWPGPRMVFVNSMSDLFHIDVPEPYIAQVFDVIARCPQHTFQMLTKRAERLARLAPRLPWPMNLWAGVSVESKDFLWRIDYLRRVPSAVRFVSAEPLLGPLDGLNLDGIHWLIAGGESQSGARPCNLAWLRGLRDGCRASRVPFFLKQLGGHPSKRGGASAVLDGRLWRQFPLRTAGVSRHN